MWFRNTFYISLSRTMKQLSIIAVIVYIIISNSECRDCPTPATNIDHPAVISTEAPPVETRNVSVSEFFGDIKKHFLPGATHRQQQSNTFAQRLIYDPFRNMFKHPDAYKYRKKRSINILEGNGMYHTQHFDINKILTGPNRQSNFFSHFIKNTFIIKKQRNIENIQETKTTIQITNEINEETTTTEITTITTEITNINKMSITDHKAFDNVSEEDDLSYNRNENDQYIYQTTNDLLDEDVNSTSLIREKYQLRNKSSSIRKIILFLLVFNQIITYIC